MFYQIETRERFSFQGGLCPTDPDPDAWFSTDRHDIVYAQQVCNRCPIRAECLDHSIRNDERFGVWGGLTDNQRGFFHKTRF